MATRTKKRSRSGAKAECPVCGKKLRGLKGMVAHVEIEHCEQTEVIRHLKVQAEEVKR